MDSKIPGPFCPRIRVFLGAFLAAAAAWLFASETGEIKGRVMDDAGHGLPGV